MTNVSTKPYDLAVIIGRFQIPHVGHKMLFDLAKTQSDTVLVLLGSANKASSVKHPFSVEQRILMLESFTENTNVKFIFDGINDYMYTDNEWIKQVQQKITLSLMPTGWRDKDDYKVCIVGNKKADTGYLEWFPQYDLVTLNETKVLNIDATRLRDAYFSVGPEGLYGTAYDMVPPSAMTFLRAFAAVLGDHKYSPQWNRLHEEWTMLRDYKAPFPPVFVTVDAVVIKSGHILLIQRGDAPGKGLWALPGGFLDVSKKETIKQACLRELNEETKIDLPPRLIEGAIKATHVFDHPDRSERGRTITHAFLFNLDGKDLSSGLPRVKGSDDACDAKWFPLSDIDKNPRMLYEDHGDIITKMIGFAEGGK